MNAPHICKLGKNCLTGIGQCEIVLTKRLNSLFSIKYILSVQRIFTAHI
jgi:hypothetical protein